MDQVLGVFGISPDYDLGVMRDDQTLFDIAERGLRGLREVLERERPDLSFTVVRDQSTFVEESVNDAIFELLIGALMASLVVFIFFRDLRNTLVTVAGLPVIVIGTFAVMGALGLTLNIVSLLALALSVGLIIDDAIVVRENIFRHMERGESPKVAASRGTAEVALPVLAMSLTIVSVFLPIAFTGGLIGRFFRSFGLVVAVAVLISLFEAFTLAPMLSAYFFKQKSWTMCPTRTTRRAVSTPPSGGWTASITGCWA